MRNLSADITSLKARIASRESHRKGCRDLQARLIASMAQQMRREIRADRKARAA